MVGVAVFVVAIAIVGLKTTLGDKAIEIPSEEHTESTLHLQESNKIMIAPSPNTTTAPKLPQSGSAESSESGSS